MSIHKNKTKDMSWLGWDVHAHTPSYRPVARAWREALQLHAPEPRCVFIELLHRIQAAFPHDNVVQQTLCKFNRRWNGDSGGWIDPDLDGINIAKLLRLTWNAVVNTNDRSILHGFREQLHDIGQTCIQGDSHRLFGYFVAITNDAATNRKPNK